jgi:hypothetical protein
MLMIFLNMLSQYFINLRLIVAAARDRCLGSISAPAQKS